MLSYTIIHQSINDLKTIMSRRESEPRASAGKPNEEPDSWTKWAVIKRRSGVLQHCTKIDQLQLNDSGNYQALFASAVKTSETICPFRMQFMSWVLCWCLCLLSGRCWQLCHHRICKSIHHCSFCGQSLIQSCRAHGKDSHWFLNYSHPHITAPSLSLVTWCFLRRLYGWWGENMTYFLCWRC